MSKSPKVLKKETIRFYKEDTDLIRDVFPGGYNKIGINEVIRGVVHEWVNVKLRGESNEQSDS